MSNQLKSASGRGLKWGLITFGVVGALPIIGAMANGSDNLGKIAAVKLVIGVFWALAVFVGVTLWGVFRGSNMSVSEPQTQESETTDTQAASETAERVKAILQTELSKWNYVGVLVGVTALGYFFGPKIVDGTLESRYLLGVAMWVALIAYCAKNIITHKKSPTTGSVD
ncbi:MAG: hypothetical protein RL392_832 [Pseudomonadota bacterium]|jgi:hypothetical protein